MKDVIKPVAFKGKQSYLELRLAEGVDYDYAKNLIVRKLESGGGFFIGSRKVRVIGSLTSTQQDDLQNILLQKYRFSAVDFDDEPLLVREPLHALFHGAHEADLAKRSVKGKKFPLENKNHTSNLQPEQDTEELDLKTGVSQTREGKTLFVYETVRNGQRVAYDGHVVVIGDVNKGAELVATGDIFVLGALRGRAHAGSAGDEFATVSAVMLLPQQLRIGARVAIAPDEEVVMQYPEIAYVLEDEIIVVPLNERKTNQAGR